MKNLGNFYSGQTIRGSFNSRSTSGAPITLAGTPALAVYKDGGTTEATTGVTLTVDFDSVTGHHLYEIVTTDAFYAKGSDFRVVLTAGTVDSVSVVGVEVGLFSIENRSDELILRNAFVGLELPVATVVSSSVATLTGGPTNDIPNVMAIIYDESSPLIRIVAEGSYVGSTGTLTLTEPLMPFTEAGDKITLVAVSATSSTVTLADGSLTAAKFAAGAINAAAIASDAITDAKVAADAVTKIQAGLATPTNITAGTITTVTNLTNAPTSGDLTATMKASVNTEIDTALADIHLDHLLAADYDPASKPGVATALLNELVENDGGVARYTANALEQAPSGTGASAVSIREEIDANSTQLTAIKAKTDQFVFTVANQVDANALSGGGSGLDAAGMRAALGMATANLDAQLGDIPTVAEFDARSLPSADYFVVGDYTSPPTAAAIADAVWDEATSGHATAGTYGASVLIIGVGYTHSGAGGTATATITRA